jgi:hypothetical protein
MEFGMQKLDTHVHLEKKGKLISEPLLLKKLVLMSLSQRPQANALSLLTMDSQIQTSRTLSMTIQISLLDRTMKEETT